MKMQLFETLRLKFETVNWANDPELGLIDTILENHPELFTHLKDDIIFGNKENEFGRKDIPSIEQIARAAIYKELKQLDYRELEYHQVDSRICLQFIKIDDQRMFSFQMYQKYISRINAESLNKLFVALNKIAINEGLEDVEALREDATVVETNIHYPTNNSLVWDCIKESHRLLKQLEQEITTLDVRDYMKGGKKTFFKINVTKSGDKRVDLFNKQLITFTKSINQVSNAIKKKASCSLKALFIIIDLERLLPVMEKVYSMAWRREINKESVPNDQKIFSIYEQHTDIIVKGSREVQFGHKINLVTGKSNLVLSCEVLKGNPKDSTLYQNTLDNVIADYQKVPRDLATDGGYASKANLEYAQKQGVTNIVFNKIVGSLKNAASSLNMETRLKKWRSGIEATISNIKRGFGLFRCNWKGQAHFDAKVMWSVIGYNIRVMTGAVLARFKMA
ncbi:MAG: ISNCY family transposase [Verrucomicrobia bacterium]|nr:ISNCY family transposase [Prolixibacteraceae bacterium]